MRKTFSLIALLVCVLSAPATNATIMLFDIDSAPGAWDTTVAGLTVSTAYDFNLDSDYGIEGFDGPLTSAGAGPVTAGILSAGVVMDRIVIGGGDPGLVAVGPSASFGNLSNAVLANIFVDAFSIISFASPIVAFEFNVLTLLGGGTVDLTVHDDMGGETLFAGISAGLGLNLGIFGSGGMNIVSVEIFDPNGGAEGVQGAGLIYNGVPAPATLGLLGIGLAVLGFGRKRKAA